MSELKGLIAAITELTNAQDELLKAQEEERKTKELLKAQEKQRKALEGIPIVSAPSEGVPIVDGVTGAIFYAKPEQTMPNVTPPSISTPNDATSLQFQSFIASTHPEQNTMFNTGLEALEGAIFDILSFFCTMHSQGYVIHETPYNNSFFHVMTEQLSNFGEETTHEWIRQHAIGYIQRHENDFLNVIISNPDYINQMSLPNTIADYPIIAATSRVTETNINIHYADGSIASISHDDYTRTIEIGYTDGRYISLIPQEPAEESLPGHVCCYFGASS